MPGVSFDILHKLKRGVVFIAPVDRVPATGEMVSPAARFYGHWEAENGGGIIELGPQGDNEWWDGAEEAIAWGRARAPVVMIRLGNREDTYFTAGDVDAVDPHGPLKKWPPKQPPYGWWSPGS